MLFILPVLFLLERFYFHIADRYNIIDKPNQRSSHSYITRRGGGIIFPIAWLLYASVTGFELPWFTLGLVIIAVISFMDDLKEVAVIPRITSHAVALFLAFYDLGVLEQLPFWGVMGALLFSIAILNAVNFMDGINGITSLYALVFFSSLALTSEHDSFNLLIDFNSPFPYIISSLLVFTFYNFRKKALCFAGDVGSVSIAYLMLGTLMVLVNPGAADKFSISLDRVEGSVWWDLKYLLLLGVYGVDSLLTIIHRLILKENILKGHRKHLYQYMANEAGIPHLVVALIYAVIQVPVSYWVLNNNIQWVQAIGLLFVMSAVYVAGKWFILHYLLKPVPAIVPASSKAGTGAAVLTDFKASGKPGAVILSHVETESSTNGKTIAKPKPALHPVQAN